MSKKKKIVTRILFALSLMLIMVVVVMAIAMNSTTLDTVIRTGTIDINLNDGVVIFSEDDLNLQPSQSVKKEIFIENVGTEDFYYRIYLEEISGELVNSTIFNIYDENGNLLKTVETADFNSANYFTTDEIVEVGESLVFEIEIVFADVSGNVYQDGELNFDIVASAIQSKNN